MFTNIDTSRHIRGRCLICIDPHDSYCPAFSRSDTFYERCITCPCKASHHEYLGVSTDAIGLPTTLPANVDPFGPAHIDKDPAVRQHASPRDPESAIRSALDADPPGTSGHRASGLGCSPSGSLGDPPLTPNTPDTPDMEEISDSDISTEEEEIVVDYLEESVSEAMKQFLDFLVDNSALREQKGRAADFRFFKNYFKSWARKHYQNFDAVKNYTLKAMDETWLGTLHDFFPNAVCTKSSRTGYNQYDGLYFDEKKTKELIENADCIETTSRGCPNYDNGNGRRTRKRVRKQLDLGIHHVHVEKPKKKKSRYFWTETEDFELRRMLLIPGIDHKEIANTMAKKFGRSPSAVTNRIYEILHRKKK
jgi:hypothetical protein